MRKSIALSAQLTENLIRQAAALTIKRSVVTAMAATGLSITPEGREFVEEVAALNADYRRLIYAATQEAIAAGYDPVDQNLKINAESGIAFWGTPDDQNPGEGGGGNNGGLEAEQG